MIHASALGDSGTSQPYVKHILYSIFNNIFPRQKPAGYSHPAGFYYVNPKSASRRRSAIGWIYCKDGRTMSTKWTFVR